MPRLPDINLADWWADQAQRFQEATAGLLPALEFEVGAQDAQAQIPPDFEAVGGIDQWQEAEISMTERQLRLAQQESEEELQRQIEEQTRRYQEQQAQAEQERLAAQQEEESSVMSLIRGLGIPTPSEAFASFTGSGDTQASTGVFDVSAPPQPEQSPEEQFNQFAGGMNTEMFGPPTPSTPAEPPPDNESSTGLLDQLGSAISLGAEAVSSAASRAWESSAPETLRPGTESYRRAEERDERIRQGMAEGDPLSYATAPLATVGRYGQAANELLMQPAGLGLAGRFVSELAGEPEIGTYAPGVRDVPLVGEPLAESTVTELAAPMMGLPGKAGRAADALAGVAREGVEAVSSKISPQIVAGIRQLAEAGWTDDALIPLEQKLANDSDVALSEVQKLTRGTPETARPWEPTEADRIETARQEAEIAASGRPAHSAYIPEDEFGDELAEAISPTPYQPGTPRARTPTETPYNRGVTPEEAAQMGLPGFEDVARPDVRRPGEGIPGYGTLPRSTNRAEGGITRGEEDFVRETVGPPTRLTAAERERAAAELLDTNPERIRELQAQEIDPRQAGIEQAALRQASRGPISAMGEAQEELSRLKQEIADGVPADDLPHFQAEVAYWTNELALRVNEARMAIKAPTAQARAASKQMNAQKQAYEGAILVQEAQRLDDVGKAARKAAKSAQRVARSPAGPVDEGTLKELGDVATKLRSRRTRKALTSADDGAGGGGTPRKTAGATPPGPREETLAERLGRLQLRKTRMEDTGADLAERSALQTEIDDVTRQIWERADEALNARLSRTKVEPTLDEYERLISEAVGRRFQSRVAGELRKAVPKVETPLQEAIRREIDRVTRSEEWVQAQADKQIRRRIDGELAKEQRANVRAEIKQMAQEAQIWAKRIQKMPQQRPALEEEFDAILSRMRQHSTAGAKVADTLAERLDVRLQEDVYQRAFRESRAATRGVEEAHIQSVVDQIRDIQSNPRSPEAHLQVAKLYRELEALGLAGTQKATSLRRAAHNRGILKAGLDTEGIEYDKLTKLLEAVDPKDPKTMKPIFAVMRQPGLLDIINEISYIHLLSNPLTHLMNISSTVANGTLRTMLRNPLEFIGSFGQTRGQGAALKGVGAGVKEGVELARTTFKTGINPRRLERAVARSDYRHVDRELLPQMMEQQGLWGLPVAKKFAGKLGESLHVMSTRPLEAMDAMLGHMAYTSAIYEKAQQRADDLLRSGGEQLDEILELMPSPGQRPDRGVLADYMIKNIWDFPEIIKEAGKIEDYTLFRSQEKGAFGHVLRSIAALKEIKPDDSVPRKMLAVAANFALPFQNVPYNFWKQGAENVVQGVGSPLTLPLSLAKGAKGAVKGDAEARRIAGERFAKAGQGALLMTIPALLAADDNLTGIGPSDPAQRRVWLATHRPNSFRFPGTKTWITYEGTPLAIPFATVAGIKEAWEFQKPDPHESALVGAGRMLGGAGRGAVRGAMSQSLVESFTRNFELFGDRASENNLAQFAASLASRYSPHTLIAPIPSGMLGFLANITDTVERETGRARRLEDVGEVAQNTLEARIPILRQRLPERRGAYGEVLEKPIGRGILGYQGPASMPEDPISNQLQRGRVGIPNAPEEIPMGKGALPITIQEQQLFQEEWGRAYRQALEEEGAGKETLTDEELKSVRDWARKRAVSAVLDRLSDEELDRRWLDKPPVEVAP